MIISASRRTDIPSTYMPWFINRLKEGSVLVRNPMNYNMVSRVSLRKEDIDCIVFWTKQPADWAAYAKELADYPYYMHYTINGYDKALEPGLPDIDTRSENFKNTAKIIGRDRMIWRYSPVILNADNTMQVHIERFAYLAEQLKDVAFRVMVSFIDVYDKIKTSMQKLGVRELTQAEKLSLLEAFQAICIKHNIELQLCSDTMNVSNLGITHGSCIDRTLAEKLCGYALPYTKDKGQKASCLCAQSIDVGAYNTCPLQCTYCYANINAGGALKNSEKHNPSSPLLFGELKETDVIKDRKIIKVNRQGTLF